MAKRTSRKGGGRRRKVVRKAPRKVARKAPSRRGSARRAAKGVKADNRAIRHAINSTRRGDAAQHVRFLASVDYGATVGRRGGITRGNYGLAAVKLASWELARSKLAIRSSEMRKMVNVIKKRPGTYIGINEFSGRAYS